MNNENHEHRRPTTTDDTPPPARPEAEPAEGLNRCPYQPGTPAAMSWAVQDVASRLCGYSMNSSRPMYLFIEETIEGLRAELAALRARVAAPPSPAAQAGETPTLLDAAQHVIDVADTTGEMGAPFVVDTHAIQQLAAAVSRGSAPASGDGIGGVAKLIRSLRQACNDFGGMAVPVPPDDLRKLLDAAASPAPAAKAHQCSSCGSDGHCECV